MTTPEVIDIGVSKLDSIDIGGSMPLPGSSSISGPSQKSVNFGGGIDMLMNTKKKTTGASPKSDINIDDLNKLEDELNNLSEPGASGGGGMGSGITSLPPPPSTNSGTGNAFIKPFDVSLPTDEKDNAAPTIKLNVDDSLGKSTSTEEKKDATWDGFKKFNDIPVDPTVTVKKDPPMTKEQLLREKFKYMKKLERLSKKGANVSKRYTMDDSLDEMKGEYEDIMAEKEKSNSMKFQANILLTCVSALEFLNNKVDPFDLKLDGWSESVEENIEEYDEIFAELHEKYKTKAKMAPELKLLFQLGGSAAMLHMTNSMFKSAMPGMDDIMRQNPELMAQFNKAAMNSMAQQNPGFGGFMGNIMGGGGGNTMPPQGAPAGPRQPDMTAKHRPEIIPPGPSNRPDIGMSRGVPNFGDAVNMEDNFGSMAPQTPRQPPRQSTLPDMKGPSDISDLLSGLKTKRININQEGNGKGRKSKNGGGGGSTISIDELKAISKDADNVPRKSKRRPRSERNTVSLDI